MEAVKISGILIKSKNYVKIRKIIKSLNKNNIILEKFLINQKKKNELKNSSKIIKYTFR